MKVREQKGECWSREPGEHSSVTSPILSPRGCQETAVIKLEWAPEGPIGHPTGGYLTHSGQENRQLLKYFQGQKLESTQPKTGVVTPESFFFLTPES